MLFNSFVAATSIPLAAEPIADVFGLHFTNSMLYGLLMAALVLGLFGFAASRSQARPTSKFAFAVENLMEFVLGLGEENLGSRKKAIRFMPLLLTLFTFILFSNLFALVPGVGTVNVGTAEGEIPLLRAFTTDLNATLALAILTIGTIQVVAIRELGIKKHLQHYFTNKPYNPMNLFIGLIEVMGEFIRIITLSMRLFGVIYAGEVLIHVVGELAGNFGWAATFPIYLLEVFFGVIQAYLFMMLSMVYLAIATSDDHADEHDDSPAHSTPVKQPVASAVSN
jgi:F-type H+-transporting ATPase subunit a